MFVVQEAREAKITLNVPEQYSNITNPIVHDSVGVKQDTPQCLDQIIIKLR